MKANVVTYNFCNATKRHTKCNKKNFLVGKQKKIKFLETPWCVRKLGLTNLTALCESHHSTLSSWDRNYLILFSSVHNQKFGVVYFKIHGFPQEAACWSLKHSSIDQK